MLPQINVKIDNCTFPSDCLYDLENLTWVRFLDEDGDEGETEKEDKNGSKKNLRKFVIGITPIYSYLSGKVTDLKLKEVNTLVQKNKSVASFSSIKHFGTVRSPLAGKIIEINMDLT